jgi:hypothetical protein
LSLTGPSQHSHLISSMFPPGYLPEAPVIGVRLIVRQHRPDYLRMKATSHGVAYANQLCDEMR